MRILIVSYYILPYTVGGMWRYVKNLKDQLVEWGHHVDIFSTHINGAYYHMVERDGEIFKKPLHKLASTLIHNHCHPDLDPQIRMMEIERTSFEFALSLLPLKQYDIIHTQDIISTRAVFRIKPEQTPLVATLHGCVATERFIDLTQTLPPSTSEKVGESLSYQYYMKQEYLGAISSDCTILPSYWNKQILHHQFHVPLDQMTVVPNGFNVDEFVKRLETAPCFPVPTGKKVIICPARLIRIKGHIYLIEALAKVYQERQDWVCWLFGIGDQRKKLEVEIKKFGLQKHILLMGATENIYGPLKQADIFVLPSLQDCLPYAVAEAQIAGKAIIASNAGGIPEMIEHGKTGLIFTAGDSDSLYRAFGELLENAYLRKKLGDHAKKWGTQKWAAKDFVGKTVEIYEQQIALKKKGNIQNDSPIHDAIELPSISWEVLSQILPSNYTIPDTPFKNLIADLSK